MGCALERLFHAQALWANFGLNTPAQLTKLGSTRTDCEFVARYRRKDGHCAAGARRLVIVACVSDSSILEANLLSSPCLNDGSPNELVVVTSCPTPRMGSTSALRSETEWVVCVHQDVWACRAGLEPMHRQQQLDEAERRFGPTRVAGVYGVGKVITLCDQSTAAGRRAQFGLGRRSGRTLRDGPELPAKSRNTQRACC